MLCSTQEVYNTGGAAPNNVTTTISDAKFALFRCATVLAVSTIITQKVYGRVPAKRNLRNNI